MQVGDLIKCNRWVHEGRTGIILQIKGGYCPCAYVLLDIGVKLVSIKNLEELK
tara:strand:+ start:110 stop:268 length:159 start_codon:yes stop_codon:yes gene_type:complete